MIMTACQSSADSVDENEGSNKNAESTPLLAVTATKGYGQAVSRGLATCPDATSSAIATSSAPATAALAAAMLVQSYLLVGVFPYSGFLALHLLPSLTTESAGRVAGLVASSFMAGRALTSFGWGRAADRHGRTFTVRASLLLSAGLSVCFGLAPTLPLALAARFALGLSNGIVLWVKVLVMEMSRGDKREETRTMAIVMGMWGYG